MKRLIPMPVMSLLILALWLVLAPAPTIGQILIGVTLAVALPWLTRGFWPDSPRLANPIAAALLTLRVLIDIVVANLDVARRVLGPVAQLRPAFLEVPLDIRDPFVASLLGSIVSLTPGTVSIDIKDGVLLVHALHVTDADAAIAQIKTRYETPLRKVFAC